MRRKFQTNIMTHLAIWSFLLGAHLMYAPINAQIFGDETNHDPLAADHDQLLAKLKTRPSLKYLQSGNNELRRLASTTDGIVEYQKISDGLEILGNRVSVYLDAAGNIDRIQDDSTAGLKVGQKQPQIGAAQAVNVAASTLNDVKAAGSDRRLVWFRKVDQGILAWQIETAVDGGGPGSPTHVLTTVDANTGAVLSQSQRDGNEPYVDPDTGDEIIPRSPIVINDTAGTAQAQSFGATFPASICRNMTVGCTGTLIAPNVVLAARHCNESSGNTINFGPNSNAPQFSTTVQSVSLPAGPGSLLDGGDVSILVLNANVPANIATPMRLLNETDALVGLTASAVGYGGQGVGSTGVTGNNGIRWAGQNVIDVYGIAPGSPASNNIFSTDFDDGTSGSNTIAGSNQTPLTLEATTASGDSGGPLLVTNSLGEHFIAGALSGGTTTNSVFGDISFWTGISNFKTQIEAAGGDFVDLNDSPFVLQRDNTNDASFHVASNWDPSVTPNELSFLIFDNSAANYEVRFNNDTGNRTVNTVVVQSDDVGFTNPFNGTRHVLTVRDLVAVADQGILTVQGVEVTSPFAFVSGTLNVGGAFLPGSSFVTSGPLLLDNGTLNITDGNSASTSDVITGGNAEIISNSNVVVEDNGSEWDIAGELLLSSSGTTVIVADGATLRSNGATLQNSSVITIEGANSQWINSGGLFFNGPPRLDIDNGGLVDVSGSVVNGTILFGGSGGTLIAPAGLSGTTIGADGTCEIQGSVIENSTSIFPSAGSTLTITGNVTNTLASLGDGLSPAGTIRIEGSYNGGAINVAAQPGTVELAGNFNPANAGSQQTGTVRFQGVNLLMESSTTTNIQIASVSDFDVVEVIFDSGGAEPNLSLDGQLNVELLGGFQLAAGQSFEILEYATFGVIGGTFANAAEGDVVLTNNGFDLVVNYQLSGSTGRVLLETQVAGGGNPPPNDDWPNGTVSTTFPINVTGTNVDATVQPGELQISNAGATVWWFFDAPDDGTVTIDTFGSDFDTQLHIFDGFFNGATVADLNPVVNDDDSGGTVQSEVTFSVTAGTCYEIRVGGFDTDGGGSGAPANQGNIVLNGTFEPADGIPGDVNCDGVVNLLDVQPFIDAISNSVLDPKADVNGDGADNLLDVEPFIQLIGG